MSSSPQNSPPALEKLLAKGAVWRPAKIKPESEPPKTRSSLASACFGIPELDDVLPHGGLPAGHLHEWTLVDERMSDKQRWHPPLTILASLLGQSITAQQRGERERIKSRNVVVWIGRNCWPTPYLLSSVAEEHAWPWQRDCLFIDPPGNEKKLWTFLQTLRSPAVFAVVGDVGRLTGVAARRMQLAAEEGRTLGLLVRPPWELGIQSSAYSKWKVSPAPVPEEGKARRSLPSDAKHWFLELLRIRGAIAENRGEGNGALPGEEGIRRWLLEWNSEHGKGSFRLIEKSQSGAGRLGLDAERANAGAA